MAHLLTKLTMRCVTFLVVIGLAKPIIGAVSITLVIIGLAGWSLALVTLRPVWFVRLL